MQRCTIWTVSLAAALSLTGAAWAEHEGGGGHGPAASHGTTPTFAKHGESDEARESHSGAQHSEGHSAANFAARLANNPTLSARLLKIVQNDNLMASGTTMTQLIAAAQGFRNQGQFLAALHAAQDLNIPFDQLKADMTGPGHDSLGQAIQDLKPTDAPTLKSEVTKARQEAQADVQGARAAKDKAEDAKEAAKDKAEDANEGRSAAMANFAARLANNPTLSARLLKIVQNDNLMASGTTMTQLITAAQGFRSQGQFLAALHAAKDLNIPFDQLKADMTGPGHDSLGQAIQDLKPTDAPTLKSEVTKARQEAQADLQGARAAQDKAEDANEAAQEAAEDAKEAAREAAEDANEAAKTPTSTTTTGTSSTTGTSVTKP